MYFFKEKFKCNINKEDVCWTEENSSVLVNIKRKIFAFLSGALFSYRMFYTNKVNTGYSRLTKMQTNAFQVDNNTDNKDILMLNNFYSL